ncbi:hypothetical protein GQ44DRAFT_47263 [Phaeosphaeriaceae sp. PMI808]|nr:hypothetical protein GQ44DRAFT_47263 [Phaeosphaeriaceae sp. PMI808]
MKRLERAYCLVAALRFRTRAMCTASTNCAGGYTVTQPLHIIWSLRSSASHIYDCVTQTLAVIELLSLSVSCHPVPRIQCLDQELTVFNCHIQIATHAERLLHFYESKLPMRIQLIIRYVAPTWRVGSVC